MLDDFTSESEYSINVPKLKEYHKQIIDLKNELNLKNNTSNHDKLEKSDIISILLNMPEAFIKKKMKYKQIIGQIFFKVLKVQLNHLYYSQKKEKIY